MSFRCDECGNSQPAGTGPVRVTTEVRKVQYVLSAERARIAQKEGKRLGPFQGREIVREKNLCQSCARKAPDPQFVSDEPKIVTIA